MIAVIAKTPSKRNKEAINNKIGIVVVIVYPLLLLICTAQFLQLLQDLKGMVQEVQKELQVHALFLL